MNKKPKITDGRQLAQAVNRYRQQLCGENPRLDGQLTLGKMQRVPFSTLVEPFDLRLFDA